MLNFQGSYECDSFTDEMKTTSPFRRFQVIFFLAFLAVAPAGFAGDVLTGPKVGDTVDVRSGLMFLNNATLIGMTSSNMTVMAGLDYYSLPITGTVVRLAQTHADISVRAGDWVDVKSDPQIILKHALLTEMTSSNITVATRFEIMDLPLSNTVVRPAEAPLREPTLRSPPLILSNHLAIAKPPSLNTEEMSLSVSDPIVQQILGKYASDPHYNDSLSYYTSMINGIQSGSVQLDDLVREAEQVLGTLDQYEPERVKDPEFEGNISTLRDFVNRAKAGEKVEIVQ
jgi:hypothetical protein